MNLLKFFFFKKKKTAEIAKKRLHLLLSERKKNKLLTSYLPKLKVEILQVICKYIKIDPKTITIHLEKKNNNLDIIELNIIIP